jgi:hypothetical protein
MLAKKNPQVPATGSGDKLKTSAKKKAQPIEITP